MQYRVYIGTDTVCMWDMIRYSVGGSTVLGKGVYSGVLQCVHMYPLPTPVLPSVHTLTQYCTTSYTVLYHVPHTHCIGTYTYGTAYYIHTGTTPTYYMHTHLHCTLYDTSLCTAHAHYRYNHHHV